MLQRLSLTAGLSFFVTCLLISVTASSDSVRSSSNDLELIKLYLEEFRLELLSVKSQLVRMSRNSKLLRTTLRDLRSSKCEHGKDARGMSYDVNERKGSVREYVF